MLKQILLFCFFVSIVSSCKCNKGNESTSSETTTTTQVSTDGTEATGNKVDSTAAAGANSAATTGNDQSNGNGKSLFKKGKERASGGANANGFFPEGSERLLADKDLEFLSAWGYAVMKNEIYARHGMTFPDGMLKDHFERQPWYHATSSNVKGKLSSIERSNISFMENYKDKPTAENGD